MATTFPFFEAVNYTLLDAIFETHPNMQFGSDEYNVTK